ncbi:MAG: chemotaxis protein CheW [Bacillota bacterium]|nr:chemotaxis protein CheW [Bacillota bacterium]
MSDMQVVLFNLNGIACGALSSQVQEIVRHQEVNKVPNMPKFIDGIINLRGKVVPIVNLNKRFNVGETPITKKTKIIITIIDNSYIGYLVNEVSEITKFSDKNVESPSEILKRINNTYIKCVGIKDEKLTLILDLTAILNDSELELLDNKALCV